MFDGRHKVTRNERQDSRPPAMGYLLPIGHRPRPRPHILGGDLHGVVPLSKLSTPSQQPLLVSWPNTGSFLCLSPTRSLQSRRKFERKLRHLAY